MTINQRVRCSALLVFLLSLMRLHAQSSIELPKPNTGALGIHLKLVQSIPFENYANGGWGIRIGTDNTTIVVPVHSPYSERSSYLGCLMSEGGCGGDEQGMEFEIHNLISGNTIGSSGLVKGQYAIESPDLSAVATCLNSPHENTLEFYRLTESGSLQRITSARLKNSCPVSFSYSSILSRDGLFLAAKEGDRNIQIWDPKIGKLLSTVVSSDRITHLALSADGTMLLASAEDGSVRVWAVPSGGVVRTFQAQEHVDWADFVPGRSAVAAVASDHSAFVWDLKSGQRVGFFRLDPANTSAAILSDWSGTGAVSRDGQLLITEGAAYDLLSGARVAAFDDNFDIRLTHKGVAEITVSPDGMMLALTSYESRGNCVVRVWRIERE